MKCSLPLERDVACAVIRMEGGDPTVSDGLRAAGARLSLIAGWALIQATVGLVLRVIEDRSERLGQIIASLLGMAWTVTSFLVIPILVIEDKGPFAALEESAALLKKTWGEQLIGNFSFGLVFFLLSVPAFIVIALGFASGSRCRGGRRYHFGSGLSHWPCPDPVRTSGDISSRYLPVCAGWTDSAGLSSRLVGECNNQEVTFATVSTLRSFIAFVDFEDKSVYQAYSTKYQR